MIRVLKELRSNSGLTLMELLVAALLFAIIAATAMMVITPIMLAYSRANSLAEYNTVLDSVGNVIVSELAGARQNPLPVFDGDSLTFTSGSGSVVIFDFEDGHLRRNESPVFPAGFYGGKTISFDVDDSNFPVFVIEVTVIPSDTPVSAYSEISRDFAVRPLMLG